MNCRTKLYLNEINEGYSNIGFLQISLFYFPRNNVIPQNSLVSDKKGPLVHLYDELTFSFQHYFTLRSFAYSAAAVNTMSEEEFNAVSHES